MAHTHHNHNSAGWQSNWGRSIAVKITAPVFWVLIFVGLIIAINIQNRFAEQLPETLASESGKRERKISL